MNVQIDLSPEIVTELAAQAGHHGLTLPDYLRDVLEQHAQPVPSRGTISPQQRADAFREWVQDFPQHRTTPLPDAAISREFYYEQDGE